MYSNKKQLRDYQARIVKELLGALFVLEHRYVICQSPTGSGKSLVICMLALYLRRIFREIEIIIQTPRLEVCEQFRAQLLDLCDSAGISVLTRYMAIKRITTHNKPTILIIDECHHAGCPTLISTLQRDNVHKVIGFSATPKAVTNTLGESIFTHITYGPYMSQLIEMGYLVKPVIYCVPVKDVLFYKGDSMGDDLGAMFTLNNTDSKYETVVHSYQWLCEEKGKVLKTICFAITRRHAITLCKHFMDAGYNAATLDCKSTKRERASIVSAFRNGEIDVLVNVDLFGEGFDAPNCDLVIQARPTNSETLYWQQLGRVLRTAEGKNEGLVLDVAGNLERVMGGRLRDIQFELNGETVKLASLVGDVRDITQRDNSRKPKHTINEAVCEGVLPIVVSTITYQDTIPNLCEKVCARWDMKNYDKLNTGDLLNGLRYLASLNGCAEDAECCIRYFAKVKQYKAAWINYKLATLTKHNGNIHETVTAIQSELASYINKQNSNK